MRHNRRGSAFLSLCLGMTAAWGLPCAAIEPPKVPPVAPQHQARESRKEHWYVIKVAGQRSGWMRTTTTSAAAITTDEEMSISIKRDRTDITVSMHSTFVETPNATPISMSQVSAIGSAPTQQFYEFQKDGLKLTTKANDTTQVTTLPLPAGHWSTPAAAERRVKERMKAGDAAIITPSLSPATGAMIVTETRDSFEPAVLSVDGKDVNVVKCRVTSTAAPGISTIEYLDAQGTLIRQETAMGALPIVMMLTTQADATGKFEAPEIMVSTFVVPDRQIKNARKLARAEYVLSVPEGDLPALAPTGSQTITKLDARSARVRVDIHAPIADAKDAANPAYLAPTTVADSKDAKVLELHKRATKDAGTDPAARAEAMRLFVGRFIKAKNLSVGFASASETARSGEGDCSEHGVLLATLLRADGTPSRVVSGLIYVDGLARGQGAFGYHLWTQALLEVDGHTRWVDLDATLNGPTPSDAAHIALALSDLSDADTMTSLVSVAPLLGRLAIEVVSTTPAPETKGQPHGR